jgi:Cu-Zn family superoxide dismutase
MKTKHYLLATLALMILSPAFLFFPPDAASQSSKTDAVGQAVAVLHPTAGNAVNGIVTFTRVPGGVQIQADIIGLAAGKHGFHIHAYGDCSAPDGTSAGGHYNPDDHPHAGPDQKNRHMGDMGNLEADAFGRAHYTRLDEYIVLNGPKSIIGRGVIVHAQEDDLTSQPTGNAGARQACGVIGRTE